MKQFSFLKKHILFLILIGFTSLSVSGNVRLPNIIGSHMVLQQKSNVKLWGWASPGEKISIKTSWDGATYQTQATNDAKWLTEIKTPEAGGSYSISVKGNNTIDLEDVLIGEVWVCGGQSNMEWSGTQQLPQSIDEAPNAQNNKIRLFYVSKSTSMFPQENLDGKWVVCSPEEMYKFSAIGYFFGKNLNEKMNTPIGLINSNWGGTPAENIYDNLTNLLREICENSREEMLNVWSVKVTYKQKGGDTFLVDTKTKNIVGMGNEYFQRDMINYCGLGEDGRVGFGFD